jgi:hypothetical protein
MYVFSFAYYRMISSSRSYMFENLNIVDFSASFPWELNDQFYNFCYHSLSAKAKRAVINANNKYIYM